MSASEEAALRLRLQAKEVALRNLTKRYLAFANAIEKNTVEECEASYESLLLEISQYEFAVGKANALVETNVQQVSEYDAVQQDVEASMYARANNDHSTRPVPWTPRKIGPRASRTVLALSCAW